MKTTPFFEEDYISIEYDAAGKWLYVDWKGYQTEISVRSGCQQMLEALRHFSCHCVLNDNTRVIGIWTPAAAWVGSEWLPQMIGNGLERFAWVYSSSILSQVSTDEALRHAPPYKGIRTFYNIELAKAWLKS